MDEQKWKLLQETGHYLSVPSGVSMYPMLKNKLVTIEEIIISNIHRDKAVGECCRMAGLYSVCRVSRGS